jgi:AAA+ ATPase superfamily predicted ATPase
MFFGRDEEIEKLTTLVKVNALTIVFGSSGSGKTSLLNAGVFPPLRKTYCLPFRIRLEFQDNSPDLITQIKNVLKSEIDKYGFRVENYPGEETLWEYFHKEVLWKSITPILVFDQFEEIFILAKKNPHFAADKLQNFWEELSNLIENQIPESLTEQFRDHRDQVTYDYNRQPVKVIFAFREEFLPEFESIPFKIPSLKYSRFRLMPMSQRQAYDVVTKTWGEKLIAPMPIRSSVI